MNYLNKKIINLKKLGRCSKLNQRTGPKKEHIGLNVFPKKNERSCSKIRQFLKKYGVGEGEGITSPWFHRPCHMRLCTPWSSMNPRAKYLSLDWIFFYFFYALMINVLISCMFKQNGFFFPILFIQLQENAFHTYLAICNNSTITHKVAV